MRYFVNWAPDQETHFCLTECHLIWGRGRGPCYLIGGRGHEQCYLMGGSWSWLSIGLSVCVGLSDGSVVCWHAADQETHRCLTERHRRCNALR